MSTGLPDPREESPTPQERPRRLENSLTGGISRIYPQCKFRPWMVKGHQEEKGDAYR